MQRSGAPYDQAVNIVTIQLGLPRCGMELRRLGGNLFLQPRALALPRFTTEDFRAHFSFLAQASDGAAC